MSLGADLRRFKAKAMDSLHATVRETTLEFGDSLVTEWTPFGQPELWKSPPPADYRPGNLQSSWFLSIGAASNERTDGTDHRFVHHMDRLPDKPAGLRIFFSNSADHAGAIEGGHSSQAPVGIMTVGQAEFTPMAETIARRNAG